MKSIITGFIATLLLTFTGAAIAGPHHAPRHHGNVHRHHDHGRWIMPAIVGGAVVYALTRPEPVTVLQPNQVIIDGVIYNRQIMIIDGVQQIVLIKAQ